MAERESQGASKQIRIRLQEVEGRANILKLLRADRARDLFGQMLENPTSNNIREVIAELLQAGEEFGKMKTDLVWVSTMFKAGLTEDLVLTVWDAKDQKTRDAREGTIT